MEDDGSTMEDGEIREELNGALENNDHAAHAAPSGAVEQHATMEGAHPNAAEIFEEEDEDQVALSQPSVMWEAIRVLLAEDPAGISLHEGLSHDAIAEELEVRLQAMADDGDEVMVFIRELAACVTRMPMVPVLALLANATDMVLRLRRMNVRVTAH